MKKVLVTGATGFIGRHCLPLLLSRDYEVHGLYLKSPPDNFLAVQWHKANLLDSEQVTVLMAKIKPTHLLHFAWFAVPGKYWSSLENFLWVQASLHLLQTFVNHGGERIVMAGTCAEYDWQYGYLSERTTPLISDTVYGTCKHSLQILLNTFAQKVSISSAWGRIFFVYGPHEYPQRLVASVIRSLLTGEIARCSHGNQIRDFLFVQDVADAFIALLDSQVKGVVNIASGFPIALKDVIYNIASQLNRENLIQLEAIPTTPNEPRLLVADVGRLFEEVGWRPQYNLAHGLQVTIDWWEQQLTQ
ncbi:NAD-dependent epimerase/dehydratase [Rippkaea orientalis PCC 8801]|uniref:NAD-dependent epimerase/dehydratase n=1 Tax=Rippkaea orientalis (strain PCC 8801 / RF-1) TaxID=41431 RepID=B7JZ90_RIPO1|nr:NAD(P)-dependent oxidoreductase [Rippkaea orientalis]ACK67301.1 NAD-dependent epimerase/dehydratase [Rippkaea orientalis PCC 8801]